MKQAKFSILSVSVATFFLLTAMVGSASGQQHGAIGIRGGLNLSTLWGNDIRKFEKHAVSVEGDGLKGRVYSSYGGGLFFRYVIKSDFLAVQTEVLFNRSGKIWKTNSGDISLYTDYLSMPLLFMVMVPMDVLRPHVSLGAVGMYALHSSAQNVAWVSEGSETFVETFTESDITDHVRRMDMGLLFGVGCDIVVSPGAFVLDVRYQVGLMDVYEVKGARRTKNSSISVSTGYTLYF